jgi:hypothetical protein
VAFITTRVKSSDEDDWKKLTRMIRYLRGSIELPLILRADSVPVPKWWVDGSHATHPNMRGHSGGCMSLGKGMPINTSTKQKISTRSCTETELVATDNFMPIILWTNYFLEAQGHGHQVQPSRYYSVPRQPKCYSPRKEWSQVKQQKSQTSELLLLFHHR